MGRLGVERPLHGLQDFRNILNVYHVAVGVEHLDEAAHVCALKIVRQVNVHGDGRDRVLMLVRLVANADGEAQVAHANLVNAQIAVVVPVLLVV